jgi:hypothetical protein
MKHFKYAVSFVMVLALALVFIGCAKPPEAEKSAAKAAMDAAAAAGADKYAAADFKSAKILLSTAEAKMNAKKYEEAKQDYVNTKATFDKATAAVAEGKKAMAEKVNTAIAGLEESWKSAQASAKGLKKKIKDKKEAWEADIKAVDDGFRAVKDMVINDPAGADTKTGELKSIIEKWDAAFKELASAPAKAAKKE